MAWNPRYVAYAAAHGAADPDEMRERDRETWPGGCMIGFSFWIQEKWREFGRSLGITCTREGHGGPRVHIHAHLGPQELPAGMTSVEQGFDAWLTAQAGG